MYFKFLITLSLFCAPLVFSAHHETSEKEGLSEQEVIAIAMSAAPSNVSSKATIIDSTGKVLRNGSNGWTCMPGTPPNDNVLTRIPVPAQYAAKYLVKLINPPLMALYAAGFVILVFEYRLKSGPTNPYIDAILIIEPLLFEIISLDTNCVK